jgi:hypothetical protein
MRLFGERLACAMHGALAHAACARLHWLSFACAEWRRARRNSKGPGPPTYACFPANAHLCLDLQGAAMSKPWDLGVRLRKAATKGNRDKVLTLLREKADVNAADEGGMTPLHWAVAGSHDSCVQLLLEHGAIVDAATQNGLTPLFLAVLSGCDSCLHLLLEHGAKVDARNEEGVTPLRFAAADGHESCVRLLLDYGAVVDSADVNGVTPLHRSAQEGHASCVRLLLNCGANVDAADKYGNTPLQYAEAAENGHESCVLLLLEKGARNDGEARSPSLTRCALQHCTRVRTAFVFVPSSHASALFISQHWRRCRCHVAYLLGYWFPSHF